MFGMIGRAVARMFAGQLYAPATGRRTPRDPNPMAPLPVRPPRRRPAKAAKATPLADERLQDAAAYRHRKRIHPGAASSVRKVQKALRIEAGARGPYCGETSR